MAIRASFSPEGMDGCGETGAAIAGRPSVDSADYAGQAMRVLALLGLGIISNGPVQAQTIFPGVTGDALLDSLVANYKPVSTLSYATARDTLFAVVLNAGDDSLRCVYTGYTLYLDPNADPTQQACNGDGDSNPSSCSGSANINTEHIWPQSKGAGSGNARQDMHHLRPSRGDANTARSNYPFSEVSSAVTDRWFCGNDTYTSEPAAGMVDTCSEVDYGADIFEPREDFKGNVARAAFYFYTMYKSEADAADASFFDTQKDVFREWHGADTANALEIQHTNTIATYQNDRANPFVLDPTLVDRAYFENELPVELLSFKAYADGDDAILTWTTARERGSAGFDVQIRRPEEVAYRTLAFVRSQDVTDEAATYTYRASSLPAGRHVFRLRQIDVDGSVRHLPEREVHVLGLVLTATHVYPNPSGNTSSVEISVAASQSIDVDLVDAIGRRILDLYAATLSAGDVSQITIDLRPLAPGTYFVRVQGPSGGLIRPLIVSR